MLHDSDSAGLIMPLQYEDDTTPPVALYEQYTARTCTPPPQVKLHALQTVDEYWYVDEGGDRGVLHVLLVAHASAELGMVWPVH